jgi:hypothetical protein
MIRRIFGAAALFTALSFAGSVTPAHAQLGWTFVGVGEFDTDDVVLALGGVSVSPRGEGWNWVAGVSAYWLQYPSGIADNNTSVISVTPSVGIKNNFGMGSAQARVGYSFQDRDDDDIAGVPAFAESGGDGFVTSAQVDYWGTGSWSAQAIGSYNFGSESIWTRGRLAKRLFSVGNAGSVSLGAEAAWLDSDTYGATKIGGLVMFNPGRGTQLNAAVGQKMGSGSASDATYFTFELVLYPH